MADTSQEYKTARYSLQFQKGDHGEERNVTAECAKLS